VLSFCRILDRRPSPTAYNGKKETRSFVRLNFPVNFVTAPLIADLFLLAISAIGRQEVHDGTVGANHIYPIDVMAFFITLAYIAISIDASGLIRWLAYKVLQKGGKNGHRLYFYLYMFFFGLATLIGNDPIILSGTPFLAYMTRVSRNIQQPKAWIFTQFAMANVASAILVSSNPTNLVLAGAFNIKFITYTANIIVPVVVTAILLFPFLLYVLFRDEKLIPQSIEMHNLPDEVKSRQPANPNIPFAKGANDMADGGELTRLSTLEEIMNPYLDKTGAIFGSVIMAATLVTILALNASSVNGEAYPAYWVTTPAAFIMFCFDASNGWIRRETTRAIAQSGRKQMELAKSQQAAQGVMVEKSDVEELKLKREEVLQNTGNEATNDLPSSTSTPEDGGSKEEPPPKAQEQVDELGEASDDSTVSGDRTPDTPSSDEMKENSGDVKEAKLLSPEQHRRTLSSFVRKGWEWARETFPTTTTVLSLLPINLVPFALCMFVLVQALVTKGWVAVFAHGWDRLIDKTGTVGAIGGMGFLSVVLCNFAGTNIGTAILLCRVVQAWVELRQHSGPPITERTFWATVYSMTLGLNYGAFSTAFSASLAGLLWRDILGRKNIRVGGREFAWVNLPIITVTMLVGCAVLVGEIYIIRNESPYLPSR
jgi:Na+/H+ antiporter NhaD/arsenite permease-like protein